MTPAQTRMTNDHQTDSFGDAAIGTAAGLVPLKKKEFLARVKRATEGDKPDLRSIVEATLDVLGAALARGENVQLAPLGRARVNRTRTAETGSTTVLTVKLRRGAGGKAGPAKAEKETLAVTGD